MASLIICEKPKVAQKVALALSEGNVEQKRLHGINYYHLKRGTAELYIAPAVGHVYTLAQKTQGSGYPVFDIEWIPSYEVDKGADYTKSYVKVLESLAKKCDEYIGACDFDIEGSTIAYNIIRYACNSEKGKRMKFSALTNEDLVEAYENLLDFDYNNAHAGVARHKLDWMWGINLSRALMQAIRSAGMFKVMSIGRVQGPALSLLAKKELEIRKFKPEPYWTIYAKDEQKVKFVHEPEKQFKKEEADESLKNSTENKDNAVVTKVTQSEKKIPPNPPFDLTSLQVEAYRVFKIPPAQTLKLAQNLYEASFISYPRTSSQKLPAKLNLAKIIAALSKHQDYKESAEKLISAKRFKPHEGKKSDPAHPAIHPTGLLPGKNLPDKEKKLYDLIAKRFLSCFGEWAKRASMSVKISIGPEAFGASGSRTTYQGWFESYSPYVKLDEVSLPAYKEGEKVVVSKVKMDEKQTQPPKRYTDASIITALEKRDLGTKATRSVVIETLKKRGYVAGKKSIEVSDFGLVVYAALHKNCNEILDSKLTRQFEEKMRLIQEGKASETEVVDEGKHVLLKILDHFKSNEKQIGDWLASAFREQRRTDSILGKCNKCGENLVIRRARASGKQFAACSGYPKCTQTYPLPQHALIISTDKVCEKCGTPIYIVRRKGRRDFEMCLDPKCETKKDWGKKPAPKKKK